MEHISRRIVAPHAGAWIETQVNVENVNRVMSRPMRARGLKRYSAFGFLEFMGSRPMRARGLKPLVNHYALAKYRVAPHAGAWIETCVS